jgi:hypothetical protein
VRVGFALYAGWLTVATLLSTSTMLKSFGMADAPTAEKPFVPEWNFLDFMMFMSEEEWAIFTVWFAEVFFELVSWGDRNPLYGGVLIWASAGILAETMDVRPENENLIINVATIIGIHSISMITLTAYLLFEELQPWYEPLSFWGGGLTGLTNWGEMFTQIRNIIFDIEQYFISTTQSRVESI